MRYLETGSTNPAFNLAFEEYVLTCKRKGDYLILWQNDNTIVIGQNQNAEAEINQAFVEQKRIHVVRRSTGGGAVYHDLGNLNYSFITDVGNLDRISMNRFTEPIVSALRKLGLPAEASGRNDILINGVKVSGTAQRIYKDRVLHHGTLLFDSDLSVLGEALRVSPQKYQTRGTESVRSRVGNILPMMQQKITLEVFKEHLKKEFAAEEAEPLTLLEKEEVSRLRFEKYDTWEWNFGHAPHCKMLNSHRWPGGVLEIHLDVEHGKIKNIEFFGDFLSVADVSEVQTNLKNCVYRYGAVREILCKLPLHLYFGTITQEEILASIFDTVYRKR